MSDPMVTVETMRAWKDRALDAERRLATLQKALESSPELQRGAWYSPPLERALKESREVKL